ncbi:MAG: hypothetical protein LW850_12195, partial [Planctomycetaceae bacterium]|nr:hypothetical protein [Planctomycetaceae bacterium]
MMNPPKLSTRRDWLDWSGRGLGATALLTLLAQEGLLGQSARAEGLRRPEPRAKRAIQICLVG